MNHACEWYGCASNATWIVAWPGQKPKLYCAYHRSLTLDQPDAASEPIDDDAPGALQVTGEAPAEPVPLPTETELRARALEAVASDWKSQPVMTPEGAFSVPFQLEDPEDPRTLNYGPLPPEVSKYWFVDSGTVQFLRRKAGAWPGAKVQGMER